MITETQLKNLQSLIENGKAEMFYDLAVWSRKRQEVLKMDHNECQICKMKGRFRKATLVHHVKHLKDRPDLALSVYDNGERQLISVCKQCHEELHPERTKLRGIKAKGELVTDERWD